MYNKYHSNLSIYLLIIVKKYTTYIYIYCGGPYLWRQLFCTVFRNNGWKLLVPDFFPPTPVVRVACNNTSTRYSPQLPFIYIHYVANYIYLLCACIKCYFQRHAVARLRHCATSRKVAGSISNGVTGIFYWPNPSCPTVSLGSSKLLTLWRRNFL